MELWDIYDSQGRRTGRTHRRGDPMRQGDYHLAVNIIIVNGRGQVLCTRRSMEKKQMPGVWENPGGGVVAGETSLAGAVRELFEETGIAAQPEELRHLTRREVPAGLDGNSFFLDVYGLRRDLEPEGLTLQPGEVDAVRWMDIGEWERAARAREILAGAYSDEFFAAVRKLDQQPKTTERKNSNEQ